MDEFMRSANQTFPESLFEISVLSLFVERDRIGNV